VLLRTILLVVIAWIAVRMIRTFMRIKDSAQRSVDDNVDAGADGPAKPEDFPHGDIKDAEFIDLNAPDEPTNPPKAQ
jgi:hypothetical protein